MLNIEIPRRKFFDPSTSEFFYQDGSTLKLEHSLKSISKWEGMMHVPFLSRKQMPAEEFIKYIQCMTIGEIRDPSVYLRLTEGDIRKIMDYIQDPMTAKTFYTKNKKKKHGDSEAQTAEDYYHAMAYYGIPFECENWHFNRLIALIKTCEDKGDEGPKMTYREQQRYWDGINEARKAKYKTKG